MKKILVLAGPSAVGKTTVMKRMLSLYDEFEFVRSATTRAPRGDGHDSEYLYLSESDFKEYIKKGSMLEYTEYGGNFYGTPSSEIERILGSGKVPLLILDINGVLSLKSGSREYKTVAVYITTDMKILDARLEERACAAGNSESALATLEKRKNQNRCDFERISKISETFDAVIENGGIDSCAGRIYEIFCDV